MMKELWDSINSMETQEVKILVKEIRNKNEDISLEDQFKLFFGLVRMDHLDSALYQFQYIYDEIYNKGMSKAFSEKYSDFKIQLMSVWRVWEDECGRIHVQEGDGCTNDCGEICTCCGGPLCGYAAVLCCVGACCGQDGMYAVSECAICGLDGCWNCSEGCAGCCLNVCCCWCDAV